MGSGLLLLDSCILTCRLSLFYGASGLSETHGLDTIIQCQLCQITPVYVSALPTCNCEHSATYRRKSFLRRTIPKSTLPISSKLIEKMYHKIAVVA